MAIGCSSTAITQTKPKRKNILHFTQGKKRPERECDSPKSLSKLVLESGFKSQAHDCWCCPGSLNELGCAGGPYSETPRKCKGQERRGGRGQRVRTGAGGRAEGGGAGSRWCGGRGSGRGEGGMGQRAARPRGRKTGMDLPS